MITTVCSSIDPSEENLVSPRINFRSEKWKQSRPYTGRLDRLHIGLSFLFLWGFSDALDCLIILLDADIVEQFRGWGCFGGAEHAFYSCPRDLRFYKSPEQGLNLSES